MEQQRLNPQAFPGQAGSGQSDRSQACPECARRARALRCWLRAASCCPVPPEVPRNDTCPELPEIPNGWKSPSQPELVHGTVVTYQCYPGYQVVGPSVLMCQWDLTWSEDLPSCQRGECASAPHVPPCTTYKHLSWTPRQTLAAAGRQPCCFFSAVSLSVKQDAPFSRGYPPCTPKYLGRSRWPGSEC